MLAFLREDDAQLCHIENGVTMQHNPSQHTDDFYTDTSMYSPRFIKKIFALSWKDLFFVLIPLLFLVGLVGWLTFKMLQPAPPDTVVILSGPEGSSFQKTAEKYKKIIELHGVKVKVVTTDGSDENLQLLMNKKVAADVALVQNGLADKDELQSLLSLGTLYVQPVLVFYRGQRKIDQITQLKHLRVAIGPEGSGTHILAKKIFEANGMTSTDLTMITMDGDDAMVALKEKKLDAIFEMSELISGKKVRELMEEPGIQLMSFRQADGYVRRLRFLSHLTAHEGSFDLGRNLPPQDIQLIGTPVELIARPDIHPAISDLLISAAREIHSKAGLFRNANEFPAPTQREFTISEEAKRYYTSGSPFLYKRLPFWLASLIDRLLLLLVPLLIVIVPASRLLAPLYRWRIRSRLYRWYGVLMKIEGEMANDMADLESEKIKKTLEEIEVAVNGMSMPLAYADQLYVLREHISMVKLRFEKNHLPKT